MYSSNFSHGWKLKRWGRVRNVNKISAAVFKLTKGDFKHIKQHLRRQANKKATGKATRKVCIIHYDVLDLTVNKINKNDSYVMLI